MTSLPSADVLIVGQGIAGTLLAIALQNEGVDTHIVNDPSYGGSSAVAGAIINPLSGRYYTQPPHAKAVFQTLVACYQGIPGVFHPQPIIRLFRSELESKAIERRRRNPEYTAWLGKSLAAGASGTPVVDTLGGIQVLGGGFLDMTRLLEQARQSWLEKGRLHEFRLNYHAVQPKQAGVSVGNAHFDYVVFCEGAAILSNPWFGRLPVTPLKGEILTIRLFDIAVNSIVIRGHWLLPLGDDLYRFGATYERGNADPAPTAAGYSQLTAAMKALLPGARFEVLDHQAGIRPGRGNNIPLTGFHSRYSGLGVLNGLGSKGAMLAPYYAQRMARAIACGEALPEDSDIGVLEK